MKPGIVAMYRNKRADELTREELLEAYTHAVDQLEKMRGYERMDREMERLFTDTRKALGTLG